MIHSRKNRDEFKVRGEREGKSLPAPKNLIDDEVLIILRINFLLVKKSKLARASSESMELFMESIFDLFKSKAYGLKIPLTKANENELAIPSRPYIYSFVGHLKYLARKPTGEKESAALRKRFEAHDKGKKEGGGKAYYFASLIFISTGRSYEL